MGYVGLSFKDVIWNGRSVIMLQVESLGSLGMEFRFAETIMLQKESYGLHRGNHALLVW